MTRRGRSGLQNLWSKMSFHSPELLNPFMSSLTSLFVLLDIRLSETTMGTTHWSTGSSSQSDSVSSLLLRYDEVFTYVFGQIIIVTVYNQSSARIFTYVFSFCPLFLFTTFLSVCLFVCLVGCLTSVFCCPSLYV